MDAHPDPSLERTHITPEDLADADLGRMRRLVLVADHPQGDHAAGIVNSLGPELEQAVLRRVEPRVVLGLPHDEPGFEPLLPYRAPDRTGEDPGLQRRDPDLAIELRAPRLLVRLDHQPQGATTDLVPRG